MVVGPLCRRSVLHRCVRNRAGSCPARRGWQDGSEIRNVVVGRVRDGVARERVEAEHNRGRRELFDPICDDVVRVRFRA
jgi:hypothetical protein